MYYARNISWTRCSSESAACRRTALSTIRSSVLALNTEHSLQASSATCGSVGKPPARLQHPQLTALRPVLLRHQLIHGLRREVYEICALRGYYAAYICNSLSAFRDYLAVPSSRVKRLFWGITQRTVASPYRRFETTYRPPLKTGPIGCPEMSARNYHCTLCKKTRTAQICWIWNRAPTTTSGL
jgi:hypothetical protein